MRADETSCPFCARALEGVAPRALLPLTELSRAAAVFIGAAAVVGCGKEPAPQPPAPVTDPNQLAVPAYGAPPPDTLLQPPPPPPSAEPPPAPATDAGAQPKPRLSVPAYGAAPQRKDKDPR